MVPQNCPHRPLRPNPIMMNCAEIKSGQDEVTEMQNLVVNGDETKCEL